MQVSDRRAVVADPTFGVYLGKENDMTSQPALPPADVHLFDRFLVAFYSHSKLPERGRALEWLRDGCWGPLSDDVKKKAADTLADFVQERSYSAILLLHHPQYQGLKKAVERALGHPIPPTPATPRYNPRNRPY